MIIDKFLQRTIDTPIHGALIRLHRRLFPFPKDWFDAEGSDANDLIRTMIASDAPRLIGKLGSIELEAIMTYLYKDRRMLPWERIRRYLSWDVRYKGWHPSLIHKLSNNAGFFSTEAGDLTRFAELYLSLLPHMDLILSWQHAETLLVDRMPQVKRIKNGLSVWSEAGTPWSKALEGKRVLVIHPFEESIRRQYANRALLFDNPDILPPFELQTLKSVQSAGGETVPFRDWFQALDSMKQEIERREFDIALIGAGAYSLPLGAFIKSQGGQAIHLGGETQVLFGIYGSRWMNRPTAELMNEHWTRPAASERIANYRSIENGSYW